MDTTGFSPSSDCSSWSYTLSTLNAGDLTANIDLSTLLQDASWSASDASDWVDSPKLTLDCFNEDTLSNSMICSSTPIKTYELAPDLPTSPKPPEETKI